MKQKIIILTTLLMLCKSIDTIAQQGFFTTGNNAIGSGGSVSYTIGQQEFNSFSSIDGYVNQGVQNPYELFGITCTSSTSITNTNLCSNQLPYTWNGLTFTTAGSQTAHITNTAGCDSAATLNLTVTPVSTQPTAPANNVCVGSTLQLINATSGGVWSYNNNRATVNATGLVTGKSVGVATITYTVGVITTPYFITVNALPNVPSIFYNAGTIDPQRGAAGGFCNNKTFTVVGSPSGGVFRSTKSSVATVNCNGVVNTISNGFVAVTYTYTNTNGCSSSRTISGNVVVCASRGISGATNEKQETRNEFTMYPNPAKTLISLKVNTLIGNGTIVVTDLYGKQVKTQSLSMVTNTVDIANLAKGIYLVSTITNEGKTTKKLVVE